MLVLSSPHDEAIEIASSYAPVDGVSIMCESASLFGVLTASLSACEVKSGCWQSIFGDLCTPELGFRSTPLSLLFRFVGMITARAFPERSVPAILKSESLGGSSSTSRA